MPDDCRNIYKICRKSTWLTQEAAAELLGISVESLRAYETGQRVPPDDVVSLMADLYSTMHLIVWHARAKNDMYKRVVPEVRPKSLLQAAVTFNNRMEDFFLAGKLRRLLRIVEDNIVDPTEQEEYNAIMAELRGINGAEIELRCAKQEGGDSV